MGSSLLSSSFRLSLIERVELSLLSRALSQTAVYWGDPVPSGQGKYSFADPIEILCRWIDMQVEFTDNNGQLTMSTGVVITQYRDIDPGGYLFLGTLRDLQDQSTPYANAGAFAVRQFNWSKSMNGRRYVGRAML